MKRIERTFQLDSINMIFDVDGFRLYADAREVDNDATPSQLTDTPIRLHFGRSADESFAPLHRRLKAYKDLEITATGNFRDPHKIGLTDVYSLYGPKHFEVHEFELAHDYGDIDIPEDPNELPSTIVKPRIQLPAVVEGDQRDSVFEM